MTSASRNPGMESRDMLTAAGRYLRGTITVPFLAGALTQPTLANRAPDVTVGDDTVYVGTGSVVYLLAEVGDDSTAYDLLQMQWTQVQGPAPAQILLPTSATTRVSFADSGWYRFELQVSDGMLSGRDTAVIHVRTSLPFVITHPANDGPVAVGRPCMIRWQMDPSLACTAWYTLDGGLTWTQINTWGAEMDSCEWDVPAGLAPGTRGSIRVHEYQNDTNDAKSGGDFILVDPGQPAVRTLRARSTEHPAVFVDKDGMIRTAGRDAAGRFRVDAFSVDGRSASARAVRHAHGLALWRLRRATDNGGQKTPSDAAGAVPR